MPLITGNVRADLSGELLAFRRELFDGIVCDVIGSVVERANRDPEAVPVRDHLVTIGCRQTADLVQPAQAEGLVELSGPSTVSAAVANGVLHHRPEETS